MTSEERRKGRYERRRAKRAAKRAREYAQYDSFEWVFTYEHLYQSYRLCRRCVAWKASVQKYISEAPLRVYEAFERLLTGKFKLGKRHEFDLFERGKARHIQSITIDERVVQRCLCDNALVPMLSRSFIYDNGACMPGKGYSFSSQRLMKHLREHYRKYGNEGYILQFDFSKFFERISHGLLDKILQKNFSDSRLIKLTKLFIDAFGPVGLGLGSQISQVLALASADPIDHFIKEKCGIRGYGRYNDDGYLIHPSKEYLQNLLEGIRRICRELGITLNEKKTQIVKLSHGFTFLKARYYLLPSGRIIKKIARRSVVKMRQKLKAFRRKVDEGIMTYHDVYQSFQSWRAYARQFNAYKTIRSMEELYNELFIFTPPAPAA